MITTPNSLAVAPFFPQANALAVVPGYEKTSGYVRTRRATSERDVSGEGEKQRSPLQMQRDQGNRELALSYSQALEDRTWSEETIVPNIPSNSTFGQWRLQLRSALEDPVFLAWFNQAGLSLSTLEILPTTGQLKAQDKNGVSRTFSLDDGTAWAQVSESILTAARALAPDGITRNALYADSALLTLVAQFYGETIKYDSTLDRQRARELQQNNGFMTAGVGEARSEEALSTHRSMRGDERDLLAFKDVLVKVLLGVEEYLDQQATWHAIRYPTALPYDRSKGFAVYLDSQSFVLDADSGFQLDNQPMAGKRVNLLDFIEAQGWEVPTSEQDLASLARAMFRPVEFAPKHGNFGGALSWPIPLDQQQRQAIYGLLNDKFFSSRRHNDLPPTENAFVHLFQTRQWTDAELADPLGWFVKFIDSAPVQSVGERLRTQFNGAGSAADWVLAAIQVSLDSEGLQHPEKKNTVAGYDLSQRDNWGKPLSFVRERFTDHLRKTYGRGAPMVAYPLLALYAPELLIAGVPDSVTYGSPAWVSLKAIIAKANFHAPGTALSKTYEQLLKADLDPITSAEKDVEALAAREGLIHWAVADGAIEKRDDNNYTDAEVEQARVLSGERSDILKKASDAQSASVPSRKELALKYLKQKFSKKYGDIDFERKVLLPTINETSLLGPYSILDIYLDRPLHTRWYSTDSSIPFEQMFDDFRWLPNVNEAFEKSVTDYYDGLKAATDVTVKHLMSLLPDDDKRALQYGALKVFAEETTTRTYERSGKFKSPDKVTAQQPADSRSLLFVSALNNAVYEVNPQQGFIRRREDLSSDLKAGPVGEWSGISSSRTGVATVNTQTRKSIREVEVDGAQEEQKRNAQTPSSENRQAFNSPRTEYITDTVMRNIFKPGDRDELVNSVKGVTTFDTEVTTFEKIQAVTRALVPFASAIDRFQKGKVGEGLLFLGFDLFGFAVGGVYAGLKIARLGSSVAKVGGILTRAAISASNPFAGGKAIASRGLPLYQSAIGKGTFSWKVISTNRSVNRAYQDKQDNIAVGTYSGADGANITAQLNEITGKWYGYDRKNNTRYGTPLDGFRPDSPAA